MTHRGFFCPTFPLTNIFLWETPVTQTGKLLQGKLTLPATQCSTNPNIIFTTTNQAFAEPHVLEIHPVIVVIAENIFLRQLPVYKMRSLVISMGNSMLPYNHYGCCIYSFPVLSLKPCRHHQRQLPPVKPNKSPNNHSMKVWRYSRLNRLSIVPI